MQNYSLKDELMEKDFQEMSELAKSPLAYNILTCLVDVGTGERTQKYSKQIQEDLERRGEETSNQSVSNYLKRLREFYLIERGKRTKAQYYKINYDGIFWFWSVYLLKNSEHRLESVLEAKEQVRQTAEENKEEFAPEGQDEIDVDQVVNKITHVLDQTFVNHMKEGSEDFERLVSESEEVKQFIKAYAQLNLADNYGSTLARTLFAQLFQTIMTIDSDTSFDMPDDLKTVKFMLSTVTETPVYEDKMKQAIQLIWDN